MTVQEAIKELQVGFLGDTEEIVQAKHMGIKALEKQIPKKPIDKEIVFEDEDVESIWVCPACEGEIGLFKGQPYCEICGQKIDWEEGGISD